MTRRSTTTWALGRRASAWTSPRCGAGRGRGSPGGCGTGGRTWQARAAASGGEPRPTAGGGEGGAQARPRVRPPSTPPPSLPPPSARPPPPSTPCAPPGPVSPEGRVRQSARAAGPPRRRAQPLGQGQPRQGLGPQHAVQRGGAAHPQGRAQGARRQLLSGCPGGPPCVLAQVQTLPPDRAPLRARVILPCRTHTLFKPRQGCTSSHVNAYRARPCPPSGTSCGLRD
jgi:hypothetical protein